MTPIIIKNKSRKFLSNSSIKNKKSTKQLLPKYMGKQKHSMQKQNLLFQIERQSKKLKHQHMINKKLQKKLQIKELKNQKKIFSIKKLTQMQEFQSLERDIAANSNVTNNSKPSYTKTNFMKQSINQQLQKLNQEYKANQQKILKIKQSKKYTRFIQNMEQKNTFLEQLNNMKKYKKRLLKQIKTIKRIFHEKNKNKIAQLIMEGQIQDKIQGNNIMLYQQIQKLNEELHQTNTKKNSLEHKKISIMRQIQEFKDRYNIPEEIFQAYYKSVFGNSNKIRVNCQRINATTTFTNFKNRLQSLKQEQADEQQSGSYDAYPQDSTKLPKRNTYNAKKDTIKQTAVQTVKIHSAASSQFGEQFILPQKHGYTISQHSSENNRKKIQQLQKKYFNQQQEYDYDEYDQEDERQYGSENISNIDDDNHEQEDEEQRSSNCQRRQVQKYEAQKRQQIDGHHMKTKSRTISM